MAIGIFCGIKAEGQSWTQVLSENRDAEFQELSTDLTNRAWFSKVADQAYSSEDDRRRIVVWLDANSDFFGAYENIEAQARGEVVRPKMQ